MYDALYEMMGFERVAKLIERNVIEVAPLAFMRGRSLNDSFVILDEAQNTTNEQMKMFLTRIGFGSKAVVTGDITQVDLPSRQTVRACAPSSTSCAACAASPSRMFSRATSCAIRWCNGSSRPMKRAPRRRRLRRGRKIEVDVSYAARRPWVPPRALFAALGARAFERALRRAGMSSVRVVGAARSRNLNARYAAQDRPTNVLSLRRSRRRARRPTAWASS